MSHARVSAYFSSSAEIARLCTQNGWPDPASMRVEVLEETPAQIVCAVTFDEVIMEGSGCEAARVACWGRFHLRLDGQGEVMGVELAGGDHL
ncbi:MAG: hypothetical protein Q8L89_07630 [Gammaproteobacteria bacterium]|nr:hypothetical protein [Gammaproteobacteria bacterium]